MLKMNLKNTKKKTRGLCFLDTVEEHISGQRGLFFCSLPLDAIINGREQRDGGANQISARMST